jgi:hypothetical protein
MGSKKICILLGDEGCPHCEALTPIWEQLLSDPELKRLYSFIEFISNVLVQPPLPRDKRQALPKCFNSEELAKIPQILVVSPENYAKNFSLNGNLPIDPNTLMKYDAIYPEAAPRTYTAIKKWLLSLNKQPDITSSFAMMNLTDSAKKLLG